MIAFSPTRMARYCLNPLPTLIIASMIRSDVNLNSHSNTSYHTEELNSLTRYRFDKTRKRAHSKQSVSRLVTLLFPKLEKLVPSLSRFPSTSAVSSAPLIKLTNLLSESSKGKYIKDTAIVFCDATKNSFSFHIPSKTLELKHTIKLIHELTAEITEIETNIKLLMEPINSPLLTISSINYPMNTMIIAEICDFSRFDSPDKILAYVGMLPSTYQTGQLDNFYAHMK